MYRRFLVVLFVFACSRSPVVAQQDSILSSGSSVGVSAGLGVVLVNATDVVDYINERAVQQSKLDDFGLAAEFFVALPLRLTGSWGMKVEYAYVIKSYNSSDGFASEITYSYAVHMPTVLAQYLVLGNGYALKIGGGLGYHVARFSEEHTYGNSVYTSGGLGIKLDAEANTAFDAHLFSYIAVDMRGDFMSEFKDGAGTKMRIASRDKYARMNLFSLGLRFGLLYYL